MALIDYDAIENDYRRYKRFVEEAKRILSVKRKFRVYPIVFLNEHYITVQRKCYKESYTFHDIFEICNGNTKHLVKE